MSNLDLLNDLDIVLLAASEPDLKTLAAQGDGAIALCLKAFEGRIFAGRRTFGGLLLSRTR